MNGRDDLFRSSADYYTEFRKPYPERLLRLIGEEFNLDGRGDLLDVGCGTGQIILPLSPEFDHAVGVDVSEDMVDLARRNAANASITNAEFHVLPGEKIGSMPGRFKLATYGSALHWMNIPVTLRAAHRLLGLQGGVAILGMRSIWGGDSNWERTVVRVVQKWLGEDRRAGTDTFSSSTSGEIKFEDALTDAGFIVFDSGFVEAEYAVDIPFILGHLYTTSYCNPELLGPNAEQFEREIADELQKLNSSGKFQWAPGASYIFARKPGR